MSRVAAIIVWALLSTPAVLGSSDLCLLCPKGVQQPFRRVGAAGTTCIQQSLNMASKLKSKSPACNSLKTEYNDICCGDGEHDNNKATSPPPIVSSFYDRPVGVHETCDICHTGDFPGNSAMVIAMLNLGTGSCAQFYRAGNARQIPTRLCETLQYFAYEPCGCGEFNHNLDPPSTITEPRSTPSPAVAVPLSVEARPFSQSASPTPPPTIFPTASTEKPTSVPGGKHNSGEKKLRKRGGMR